MKRRQFISGLAGAGLTIGHGGASAQTAAEDVSKTLRDVWAAWREAHTEGAGRVIDNRQGRASHSEGQAYGMLLAVRLGDRRTFERIETWTRVNLAIRADSLMAWRWLPDEPVRVPDINNATDGDLFRAWALLQAAERFNAPEHLDTAAAIVSDIVDRCVVERANGTPLLLPGADGFLTDAGFIFNPSYCMPRALEDLAAAFDAPVLNRVARASVALAGTLAESGPLPDWVEVTDGEVRPAEGFSFDSGYEAMRVPLYYVWSGLENHPAVRRYAIAQQAVGRGRAATVIGRPGGDILETSAEAGYRSLAALAGCVSNRNTGSGMLPFEASQSYYPATLQLFAMLAQIEGAPRCIPI
ncbi:MAG: glycosyl hydrolase family 5 [Rhodobacteraceae bacterium]|jgi:endo-1,4-beta-D-glucanase Y|uniref:cellulase n=1 Tax=Salipiger profundus TaxID=1229727 RepID=A0A1U7D4B0_9RHOB|nr:MULTISPECIES: glycosyl hydrolase family 8 [Salipiger]APX22905.1 endoglucanase [Salipiger profundus]MAB07985.1 glycosyl hydrolase family 5 [Paracoccaceae bacterium]GGA11981.1 endoglucanase [Salipiger profundus]SFD24116.1 endoglucanase [Salipiger profundus]